MQTDKRVWHWRTYVIKYAPHNSTYRHVLLTLSLYMDEVGGSCFPSVETLCNDTALAKPTVLKYLHKAADDGWLRIEKHGFAGQKWKRNEYTASIPDKVVKEVNHKGGKGGKPDKEGGKPDSDKVVKEVYSNTTRNTSIDNTPNSLSNSLPNNETKATEKAREREEWFSKDSNLDIPESKEDVIQYVKQQGWPDYIAVNFYNYYEESGWCFPRGQNMVPVQNWKSKLEGDVNRGFHTQKPKKVNGTGLTEDELSL